MNVRRNIPLLLVIVGAILLAYVSWSYGSMYHEQRRLAREWERQQHAPAPAAQADAHMQQASYDDGLTKLSIPKIELDSVVVEGTTHHDLLLGPGHLKDTPAPGDVGNAVISGHRDTFFRHIGDLVLGDEILVQRGGKTYRYKVTGKKVVEPTDLSVVRPSKDAEMTLITCYPTYYIGPAPKRLVVFSKLVDDEQQTAAK